jgi:hypothetical protein
MRRAGLAVVAVLAMALYAAPAGAEPLVAEDAEAAEAAEAEAQLAEFFPPVDDGTPCTGVPETLPGIFDFTEACIAHDACYAQGVDRLACDLAFREDMIAACLSQHPDPLDFRRQVCLGFAELYFFGVRLFGQFTFG